MSAHRRRTARMQRRTEHRVMRLARASSPAERAAVGWDDARAMVTSAPAEMQQTLWRELVGVLDTWVGANSHPEYAAVCRPNAHGRAGARAREYTTQFQGSST